MFVTCWTNTLLAALPHSITGGLVSYFGDPVEEECRRTIRDEAYWYRRKIYGFTRNSLKGCYYGRTARDCMVPGLLFILALYGELIP